MQRQISWLTFNIEGICDSFERLSKPEESWLSMPLASIEGLSVKLDHLHCIVITTTILCQYAQYSDSARFTFSTSEMSVISMTLVRKLDKDSILPERNHSRVFFMYVHISISILT